MFQDILFTGNGFSPASRLFLGDDRLSPTARTFDMRGISAVNHKYRAFGALFTTYHD